MIVVVKVDCWQYAKKPTPKETSQIRRRMKEQPLSLEELCKALLHGQTVQPAILDRAGRFVSQQVFMVDVDGGRKPSDSIRICQQEKIVPMMIYRTFSGSSTDPRHRLVFVLAESETDEARRNAIQKALTRLFAGDPKANDRSRLFFGGTMAYNYMGGVIPQSKINALLSKPKGGD